MVVDTVEGRMMGLTDVEIVDDVMMLPGQG